MNERIRAIYEKLGMADQGVEYSRFEKAILTDDNIRRKTYDKLNLEAEGIDFARFSSSIDASAPKQDPPEFEGLPSHSAEYAKSLYRQGLTPSQIEEVLTVKAEAVEKQSQTDQKYKQEDIEGTRVGRWFGRRRTGLVNKLNHFVKDMTGISEIMAYATGDRAEMQDLAYKRELQKARIEKVDANVPTNLKQTPFAQYADAEYKGEQIQVEVRDGAFAGARDKDGFQIEVDQNFVEQFNSSGQADGAKMKAKIPSLLQRSEQTIYDALSMITGSAGVARGAAAIAGKQAAKQAAKNAARAYVGSTAFFQSFSDNYDAMLAETNGDADKSMAIALEQSSLTAVLTTLMPSLETAGVPNVSKQAVNKMAKRYALDRSGKTTGQKLTSILKNIAGEEAEEVMDMLGSNAIAMLNGIDTDLVNSQELMETMAATLLVAGPSAYFAERVESASDNNIMLDAVYEAATNEAVYQEVQDELNNPENKISEEDKAVKTRTIDQLKDALSGIPDDLPDMRKREVAALIVERNKIQETLRTDEPDALDSERMRMQLEVIQQKIENILQNPEAAYFVEVPGGDGPTQISKSEAQEILNNRLDELATGQLNMRLTNADEDFQKELEQRIEDYHAMAAPETEAETEAETDTEPEAGEDPETITETEAEPETGEDPDTEMETGTEEAPAEETPEPPPAPVEQLVAEGRWSELTDDQLSNVVEAGDLEVGEMEFAMEEMARREVPSETTPEPTEIADPEDLDQDDAFDDGLVIANQPEVTDADYSPGEVFEQDGEMMEVAPAQEEDGEGVLRIRRKGSEGKGRKIRRETLEAKEGFSRITQDQVRDRREESTMPPMDPETAERVRLGTKRIRLARRLDKAFNPEGRSESEMEGEEFIPSKAAMQAEQIFTRMAANLAENDPEGRTTADWYDILIEDVISREEARNSKRKRLSREAKKKKGGARAAALGNFRMPKLIAALNKPRPTDMIHEMAHAYHDWMDIVDPQARQTVVDAFNKSAGTNFKAEDWKDGSPVREDIDEFFASAFEEYVRTGRNLKGPLADVLENFARWVNNAYDAVVGFAYTAQGKRKKAVQLPVYITPELRAFFDDVMGVESQTEGYNYSDLPDAVKPRYQNQLTVEVGDTGVINGRRVGVRRSYGKGVYSFEVLDGSGTMTGTIPDSDRESFNEGKTVNIDVRDLEVADIELDPETVELQNEVFDMLDRFSLSDSGEVSPETETDGEEQIRFAGRGGSRKFSADAKKAFLEEFGKYLVGIPGITEAKVERLAKARGMQQRLAVKGISLPEVMQAFREAQAKNVSTRISATGTKMSTRVTDEEQKNFLANLRVESRTNLLTEQRAQALVDQAGDPNVAWLALQSQEGKALPIDDQVAIAKVLIREFETSGNPDSALDVMEYTATRLANTAGRALQFFRTMNELTPSGYVRYAQRTLNKVNESVMKDKGFDKVFASWDKAVNRATTQTLNQTTRNPSDTDPDSDENIRLARSFRSMSRAEKIDFIRDRLINEFGLSVPDATTRANNLVDDYNRNLKTEFKRLVKAPVSGQKARRLFALINDRVKTRGGYSMLDQKDFQDALMEGMGIDYSLSPAQLDQIRRFAEQIGQYEDGYTRSMGAGRLLKMIADMLGPEAKRVRSLKTFTEDKFGYSLWYASVLSGPSTHTMNMAANTITSITNNFALSVVKFFDNRADMGNRKAMQVAFSNWIWFGQATLDMLNTGIARLAGQPAKRTLGDRAYHNVTGILADGRLLDKDFNKFFENNTLERMSKEWAQAEPIWQRIRDGMALPTARERYNQVREELGLTLKGGVAWPLKYVGRALSAGDAFFYVNLSQGRIEQELIEKVILRDPGKSIKQARAEVREAIHGTDAEQQAMWNAATANFSIDKNPALGLAISPITGKQFTKRDIQAYYDELMEQRIEMKYGTDGQDAVVASKEFAARSTYTNKPKGIVGDIASAFNRIGETGGPIGGLFKLFVAPFTTTLANIMNDSFAFMPGVSMYRMGRFNKGEGEWTLEEIKEQHVKGIIGSAMMAFGLYVMASFDPDDEEGNMVSFHGDGPPDGSFTTKMQLLQSGWKPNSIQIGDKYVSFKDYAFAPLLAVMGDLYDSYRYANAEQREKLKFTKSADLSDKLSMLLNATARLPMSFIDKSFLSGISDIVKTMSEAKEVASSPEKSAKTLSRIFIDMGAGAMPASSFWRNGARALDPTIYSGTGDDLEDDIKTRIGKHLLIPYFRSMTGKEIGVDEVYYTALGDPARIGEDDLAGGLSRFTGMARLIGQAADDVPIYRFLNNRNIYVSGLNVRTTVEGVNLWSENKDIFHLANKKRGQIIKEYIYMNMDRYESMTTEQIREDLKRILEGKMSATNRIKNDPEIVKLIREHKAKENIKTPGE